MNHRDIGIVFLLKMYKNKRQDFLPFKTARVIDQIVIERIGAFIRYNYPITRAR